MKAATKAIAADGKWGKFQSTPPVKAATEIQRLIADTLTAFQSTPPVKAATKTAKPCQSRATISIHAAREGGDAAVHRDAESTDGFQSTPPVKAAT